MSLQNAEQLSMLSIVLDRVQFMLHLSSRCDFIEKQRKRTANSDDAAVAIIFGFWRLEALTLRQMQFTVRWSLQNRGETLFTFQMIYCISELV